jgi:hypothetical protein
MAAWIREGLAGAATCRGGALGFGDAGVSGWDPIQGRAASIRCASTAGRGGHGWRRPWGAGAARLMPRAPHGMRHRIRQEGEKVRGKRGLTGGSRVAVKQ